MIVTRSMHPDHLANTYLVADPVTSSAVIVDAGAPIEPLLRAVQEQQLRVTHILLTHEHHDHTTHVIELEQRYGAELVSPDRSVDGFDVQTGSLTFRALATPGHCAPHVAWVVERDDAPIAVFTGDVLFRGCVGGTVDGGPDGFVQLCASVDRLLQLPNDTIVYPGHTEETTIGAEVANNGFVHAWSGATATLDEPVEVAGTEATLRYVGPDYDGGTKAWVRFVDGREAIVGGSMVQPSRYSAAGATPKTR